MKIKEHKELTDKIHRTWVELLLENNYRKLAAIALDSSIIIEPEYEDDSEVYVAKIAFEIPASMYAYIVNDENNRSILELAMLNVTRGIVYYSEEYCSPSFIYRVKLIDIEEGWQEIVKNLIANNKNHNQAIITEKLFFRENKTPILYNEMKFGSQTEVRIAQELEARKILFFSLPLAIKAETNIMYQDHREPDFLICDQGKWGILEVAFHQDRYEKDSEKSIWFENSGILCIKYYTAERCYKEPDKVVEEFLDILSKY